jgi:hypothetical protein
MALRDQPILDQFQDEIFRLPLGSAVLLLGPAGTGKTTTLIHRLGQKLQQEFLDETEKARIARAFDLTRAPHGESWLMFTPTELLKQYLKEAFAREGVPASDQRIKTWNDYRRDLGRNVFGVLRTPNGTGSFVLKDSSGILAESALERPQHWFSEFDQWQRTLYVENLRKSPQRLAESQAPAAREIGLKLNSVVHQSKQDSLPDLFAALATLMPEVQTLVSDLKEETDRAIRGALNVQMHKNKRFVEDFARFLETLEEEPEVDEDLEDLEADDDEQNVAKAGRSAASAVAVYMRAVRRHARSTAAGRNLKRNSRTVRIMGWVGDRGLTEQDSHSVGKSLLVQAGARPFLNPVKRYLDGIARRYRTFRRTYLGRSAWFAAKELSPSDLDPLELDMILLAILSGTKSY